jgi:hypothetical protein
MEHAIFEQNDHPAARKQKTSHFIRFLIGVRHIYVPTKTTGRRSAATA